LNEILSRLVTSSAPERANVFLTSSKTHPLKAKPNQPVSRRPESQTPSAMNSKRDRR